MKFVREERRTIGGLGRSDRFAHQQRFGGPREVTARVLLESGTASGREPTADMPLQSYLGQFLQETGVTLSADDEQSFTMRLLHNPWQGRNPET